MQEVTTTKVSFPSATSQDVLTEVLRQGAQAMLATAIEAEVSQWIEGHAHLKDDRGHRQVVRKENLPERSITTGIGPVKIRQPRGRRRGFFLQDSPALLAEDSEHRGAVALAVPQVDHHGRLQRSARCAGGWS
jgi:hypothetical protein